MSKPRLLDVFCGAGGASVGYARAGFEVVGVDINPQGNYPFTYRLDDALNVLRDELYIDGFDAISASPPCQAYSAVTGSHRDKHPDLVAETRDLLRATGLPYVIENVEGAPLIDPVRLCGASIPGLRVIRHRLFEANFPLVGIPCPPRHPLVFTHDKRKAHYGALDQDTSFVQVTGGGNCTIANKRAAMGVPWMTGHEANEAIPPAYCEHIGSQLMAHVNSGRLELAA